MSALDVSVATSSSAPTITNASSIPTPRITNTAKLTLSLYSMPRAAARPNAAIVANTTESTAVPAGHALQCSASRCRLRKMDTYAHMITIEIMIMSTSLPTTLSRSSESADSENTCAPAAIECHAASMITRWFREGGSYLALECNCVVPPLCSRVERIRENHSLETVAPPPSTKANHGSKRDPGHPESKPLSRNAAHGVASGSTSCANSV